MTVDPTLLASHELGHIVVSGGGSVVADDAGWHVVTQEPPASEADFLNRMCAGVIAERLAQFGPEIARVVLSDASAWLTAIGEDDFVIIGSLPLERRLEVFDRTAQSINAVLLEVGKPRLKKMGRALLMLRPGEQLEFGELSDA